MVDTNSYIMRFWPKGHGETGWRIGESGIVAERACLRRTIILYAFSVIKSFRDTRTESLHSGRIPKGVPADVARRAVTKLFLLDTVTRIKDLRVPPGNRLEALSGDRKGQWSIRVNDQWRLCFIWRDGNAHDVEFVDYHRG